MKNINFSKDILPHIVAIAIFLVVVFIFYRPIFLENQEIRQNDILQGQGAGQELVEHRKLTGEEGLWTNSMFGGMPGYLINTQWSGDLLKHVQKLITLGLPSPARHTFIAFVSFYILLLVFGVRPYLAIGGAIAYGLNSFNIVSIEAGHIWKVVAIAYMPLVLAGIHLAFKKKYVWGFVLTAMAMALEIRSNHLQITYYLLIIVLMYGLVMGIFSLMNGTLKDFGKALGVLVIAVLLAVGANIGKLWSAYEYGKFSIRGPSELKEKAGASDSGTDRGYAFDWSSGKWESMTLLIPNYAGGATGLYAGGEKSKLANELRRLGVDGGQVTQFQRVYLSYWGRQPFTSGPIYAGAIVCFLFILGLLVADNKFRIWLGVTVLLSLMLSWGKNLEWFNYFIFDVVPGYNKFRAVSMTVSIALLCMPLLGFIGLEKVIAEGSSKKLNKLLYIGGGIAAGMCILVAIGTPVPNVEDASGQIPASILNAAKSDREVILKNDAIRSLLFILLSFGAVLLAVMKKITPMIASFAILLLVTFDLANIDSRYLNEENYDRNPRRQFFSETDVDRAIKRDTDLNYRVLNTLQNPWAEARTSYHHKSIGGYHGAKLRRYQDLVSAQLTNEINSALQSITSTTQRFDGVGGLNMLNAKYLITQSGLIRNQSALGNAWFVSEVQKVNTPDEELSAVAQINPSTAAVIDASKFDVSKASFSNQGSITLKEYKPNYLKYESNNSADGLAVFSEIYYPKGWIVKIDGKEADYLRANYVLRAMEIPAGQHTIEFSFEPSAYFTGNKIMWISSIILLIVFVGGLVYTFKGGLPSKETE
ncbi:MAG: YfhO family protein [Bacteroidota bacterium]